MDDYGIEIYSARTGVMTRYRRDGGETDAWGLAEAEEYAYQALLTRNATYVTVGNGGHEFRMWGENVTDYGNFTFTHTGLRWSEWYVDVEVNGRRWRYRPVADLDDYPAADELAEVAAGLHPDVTRIWVGRSDGTEEDEALTSS